MSRTDLVVQRVLHCLGELLLPRHLVVRESNNVDAKLVQLCRSIAVVPRLLGLEMLPAIEFDDDSSAHAVEVNDVARDGDLPPELEAAEAAVA